VSSWVGWQSVLYLAVLGMMCVFLVPLTSLWWIVPLVGAAVPIALALLDREILALWRRDDRKVKERELLQVLSEVGELTPTTAAMRTTLTVDEASKMLEGLSRKGHRELHMEEGAMAYPFSERNKERLPSEVPTSPPAQSGGNGTSLGLEDPLSERELEVLNLLASGRTNAEVAGDLFVSVGTIKSHTGNIYRKLGARNRAEALARARELGLLR